uniref:transposase n=1 Tax=Wolbachia endosymbiont (group A) of Lasioglossum morio TaxID=2954025 RepID=UPI0022275D64|nr:transposase [Wolbachia endosymbiont (group A) of Lasioglossum morio]
MQKNGIWAILRRKFKVKKQQTDSRVVAPNILDQNFIVDQPNKVWDYLYKNQGRMAIFGSNNRSIFTHDSWLVNEQFNK